tara:strand:+ start:170 stop:418 length:249 start_codon:yes stop_codon:yes gene_type:complete
MTTTINMGKVIKFPLVRPADLVREEMDKLNDEITLCMQDIDDLNSHVLELMVGYEQLLERFCELEGVSLDEVMRKLKDDSER